MKFTVKKFLIFLIILIGTSVIIYSIQSDKKLSINNDLLNKLDKLQNEINSYQKKIEELNDEIYFRDIKLEKWDQKFNLISKYYKPYENDLLLKKGLNDITFKKNKSFKTNKDKFELNLFSPYENNFLTGISFKMPGSAYFEIFEENIYMISNIGITSYAFLDDTQDEIRFKQIENNLNEFIGLKQFSKAKNHYWFGFKDLLVSRGKIFVSYTFEMQEDCFGIGILQADLNTETLKFEKFFNTNECITDESSLGEEFNAHQSGGRIIELENNILLSVGDFRQRGNAQNLNSHFGKLILIEDNNSYNIISLGHRNIQGLSYLKELNIIISTEHGPQGGDEINLIDLNSQEKPNFGWPISSYGEHYGGKNNPLNYDKYQKFPLHKSHKDYNFIEPLKYFVPSIGISDIKRLNNDLFIMGSMRNESFYLIDINSRQNKINRIDQYFIGERIRDIAINDEFILLYLETTGSIAFINKAKLIN